MVTILSINTFFKNYISYLPVSWIIFQILTAFLPPQESIVIPVVQRRAVCQSRLSSLYYPGWSFCSESCRALYLVSIPLKCSQNSSAFRKSVT